MKKSQYALATIASLLVVSILGPVFISVPPVNAATGDFSITATPSSGTIPAGSAFTSTITVTSNHFVGSVALSASVSPATGTVSASLSPSSVTLTSGGTGTSTLTVSTSPFTPLGTYTVTVTGTGGGIIHSTPVTVTVNTSTVGATTQASPSLATLPIIELSMLAAVTAALAGIAIKRRPASGVLA